MRICVMVCAHVGPDLKDVLDPYLDMFRNLLAPHLPEASFAGSMIIDGVFPASVDAYDVYVFTGSPHGVYEDLDWIRRAEQFVRDAVAAGKVLIGGCFGHQLIAQALGGKVAKSEKGWGIGVHTHPVLQREPWMTGGPDMPNVVVSHQDQVVAVPDGAVVLAGTDFCPNAMLRIGDRVLTFQGHPEMNIPIVNRLLDLRRERVGAEVFAAGKSSLEKPLDHADMGAWIAGFIRQAMARSGASAAAE
ncbi:MAG: type 1 glutamine amidotransferase [Thalassobaculaceae bacterium]|nr:type 1 glutamine amidotransferase [Thalassobaculaceae bacterium]